MLSLYLRLPFSFPHPFSWETSSATTTADQKKNNSNVNNQSFVPLSREREISRARALRALAGGWAVPRQITSLAPPSATNANTEPVPSGAAVTTSAVARGNEGGGARAGLGVRIVKAAAGLSHTALVTNAGRLFLFGEGAVVAGGDPTTLERVVGGEVGETSDKGKKGRGGEGGGGGGEAGLVKRGDGDDDGCGGINKPLAVREERRDRRYRIYRVAEYGACTVLC